MGGWQGRHADEARLQSNQHKYAEKINKPWKPLAYEPETRVLAFTEMCPSAASDCVTQAKRYGRKAANLGFLTNPSVLGRAVDNGSLSQQLMAIFRITRQVETAYCQARHSYYQNDCLSVARDGEKPSALDLEFKFLQNGTFVCKQVREFAGR